MPSHAKKLIDSLRQIAKEHGISLTLSKERDLYSYLVYGRPYASVIPAENAGVLGQPQILHDRAGDIRKKYGESAEAFLALAHLVVQQATKKASQTSNSAQLHHEAHMSIQTELHPVSIDIDFVSCKAQGVMSDTFCQHLKDRGERAGYRISANFVERGGDYDYPIARVGVRSHNEEKATQILNEIAAIGRQAFKDCLSIRNAP